MPDIRSIVHPTDFSEASRAALVHALRIAITAKATLTVLHVAGSRKTDVWEQLPHVRKTLIDWGLLGPHDATAVIAEKLGMSVRKVEMEPQSPAKGVVDYLRTHAADLIVLATEGRQGVARWLHGSVAEKLARQSRTSTLFVPAKARGFVDPRRGEVHLKHVLIPIDHNPPPAGPLQRIMGFARLVAGMEAEERLLHIGRDAPALQRQTDPRRRLPVAVRQGDAVETIVAAANEWPADLIGMPTAGHHGFLDALRGSTTERVLRQAPCPLLAVPVG
jgi:nucleotide-binding universal stress UspA family protein